MKINHFNLEQIIVSNTSLSGFRKDGLSTEQYC